jgi:hypothetical protein
VDEPGAQQVLLSKVNTPNHKVDISAGFSMVCRREGFSRMRAQGLSGTGGSPQLASRCSSAMSIPHITNQVAVPAGFQQVPHSPASRMLVENTL